MDETKCVFSILLVFISCCFFFKLVKYSKLLGIVLKPVNSKGSEGHVGWKFSCDGGKDWLVGLPAHPAVPLSPQAHPYQGAFQVEGLRVLAQQHDVLLQVVEAAVLVVADTLLRMAGQVTLL